MSDTTSTSGILDKLSASTKRAIVLIAIIEGALLLVMHELLVRNWWPTTSIPLRTCWYTLVIALPTTLCLLLKDLRDRRLWLMLLAYGVVLIPMAIYTGMQYVPAHNTEASDIFVPYTLSQIAIWFAVMFFMSVWLEGGSFWRTTQDVCAFTWRHALALGLIALYLLVLWALLHLWGALFKVLNIDFFETLFENRRFIYPIAGLAGGIAVVILRGQIDAVSMMERVAAALLRVLLPLLSLIIIVFLLALFFTGVQLLWKTGIATQLMMFLIGLTLLFVNVVFSGNHDRYPAWLHWPIWGALALLPIYICLCAWAMWLRLAQHGWSLGRLWAVVILLVFAAFVLSYTIAVITRRDRWLEWMPAINKTVGAATALLFILISLPMLNLQRIAAASQVHRLMIGKINTGNFDYNYLRFRLGESGYQRMLALQDSSFTAAHPGLDMKLKDALSAKNYYPDIHRPSSPADLASAFKRYPNNLQIPGALLLSIANDPTNGFCLDKVGRCEIFTMALNKSRERQYALVLGAYSPYVEVYADENRKWLHIGNISIYSAHNNNVINALRNGQFTLADPVYPDILINGERYQVQTINGTE